MTTVGVDDGAILNAAARGAPRRSFWRGQRFIAEVFDGADDALAALEAVQGGLTSTGFQTLDWLTVLYEELAPSHRAMPRLVVVTERDSGEIALILPLLIANKGTLKVARFADLGASAYGWPILGPAQLKEPRSIRRTWRNVLRAMRDVDLICLERMPVEISGRPNPLLTRGRVTPALHSGNQLVVPGTVEEYLHTLGKKYCKEVKRCQRRWEKEGAPRFYRTTSPDASARVYSLHEEQVAERHAARGGKNILDEPAYRTFYERLAMDGSEAGLAALFALEANGEIIATLFGIVHDGTFTLLRISTDGKVSGYLSPGRLIVIEAMKHFVAEGVRRFDLGVGEHPLKHGFGVEEVPLYDLIIARHFVALPQAVFHRVKGRLSKNRLVRAVFWRGKSRPRR